MSYGPFLLKNFNAHMNIKYCNSFKSIKYICKYITKGCDAASFGFKIDTIRDEVT